MRRVHLIRLFLLIVVPVAVLGAGAWFWLVSGRWVTTENAFVKSDMIQISADVDGRVLEMMVRDHDQVSDGDVLFRIDPEPFEIALDRARADVEAARTEIETLRASHREALAEVREHEREVDFLQREVRRQRQLHERGATTARNVDEIESRLAVAREKRAAAEQRANRILSSLDGDVDLPVELHPLHRTRAAVADAAALDLRRTVIRSPATGIVSNVRLEAGEYLEAGEPAFSLVVTPGSWVEANLKETQLEHVRIGQTARIVVDAYPRAEWRARVASISPATGAEFAILPPQNATGNWVKVVQRLPVRLVLEDGPDDLPLRAGMAARVSIDTGREKPMLTSIRHGWGLVSGGTADAGGATDR